VLRCRDIESYRLSEELRKCRFRERCGLLWASRNDRPDLMIEGALPGQTETGGFAVSDNEGESRLPLKESRQDFASFRTEGASIHDDCFFQVALLHAGRGSGASGPGRNDAAEAKEGFHGLEAEAFIQRLSGVCRVQEHRHAAERFKCSINERPTDSTASEPARHKYH